MVFFKGKNRDAETAPATGGGVGTETLEAPVAAVVETVAAAPAGRKKLKPGEMLASVINESTPSAAVEMLKENTAFALPNGSSWVALGLPSANIGGLSSKQKSDADKGSIIELIKGGQIATVATADMLSDEVFGIIPTLDTLSRVVEYSLLKKAKYVWITLSLTPSGDLLANPIADTDYETALAVAEGNKSLSQVLPEVWAWAGGSPVEVITPVAPVAVVDESEPELAGGGTVTPLEDPYDNPFGAEIDYNALEGEAEDEGDLDDGSDAEVEPEAEDEVQPQWVQEQGHEEEGADDEPYLDPDRVVNTGEVKDMISRRFLNSDLGLEIDLSTFEANFNTSAPAISFPLEDGATDWLGRQVNQLSRQANTELAQLHFANLDELRELYVSLMSQHIEAVIDHVSPDREGSYYSELMKAAKKGLAERQANAPALVSGLRKELDERYEREATSMGKQAAEQAIVLYRRQNRARHERELAEINANGTAAAEEVFDGEQQIILEYRRKDADGRIDIGTTKILEVLMERQMHNRASEEELLKGWSAQMMAFVDDNRKADVARADALSEKLSRESQVEVVKAEHAARIQELRAEHDAKVAATETEMQRLRSDAVIELTARQASYEHNLSLEKVKTESAEGRVAVLFQQMSTIESTIEKSWEKQVALLEAENRSYAQEQARSAKFFSWSNKTMVGLLIAVFLAALAVGFIFGSNWDGSQRAVATATALMGDPGALPFLE